MNARQQCSVCIEDCTPSKTVICPGCEFVACSTCVKRYLLGSSDDASCMNCHRLWPADTMQKLLPKTFSTGEWKRHRENVLLDRELSMLPETQPYADRELQRRENVKVIAELQTKRATLKRELDELDGTIMRAQRQVMPRIENYERLEFVHRCAAPNCDGFLSSSWKCRKCDSYTCSECGDHIGAHGSETFRLHVCDEASKASLKAIRQDSRRCIGCGVYVFKIAGCNQMWCTNCHTAWDWRTGRRVDGNIHNPHFFEARRNMPDGAGRNLQDIPCGGTPSRNELLGCLRARLVERQLTDEFLALLALCVHVEYVELLRFQDRVDVADNRDVRIQILLGETEHAQAKVVLQQREKRVLKNRDIHHVLSMVAVTIGDMLRQYIVSPGDLAPAPENGTHGFVCMQQVTATTIAALTSLLRYANGELRKISLRYACTVPTFYQPKAGRWSTPLPSAGPVTTRSGELVLFASEREVRGEVSG